jgi:thioredoxin-like negative regulator of GroEL
MKQSSIQRLAALIAVFCCSMSAVNAGDPKFDQALNTYLKNDYAKALPLFQELAKTQPENVEAHHYLALCYQNLDKDKEAATEYEYVVAHTKNAALKEIIEERLARTKRRLAKTAALPEAAAPEVQKHDPVKKVIWFSTNWCSTCKHFAPSWEKGKEKFQGSISFEHLNAEDPANSKEVNLYRPKAYPTLVYLDAKNNVIQKYADAPEAADFIKHLQELGAAKN